MSSARRARSWTAATRLGRGSGAGSHQLGGARRLAPGGSCRATGASAGATFLPPARVRHGDPGVAPAPSGSRRARSGTGPGRIQNPARAAVSATGRGGPGAVG